MKLNTKSKEFKTAVVIGAMVVIIMNAAVLRRTSPKPIQEPEVIEQVQIQEVIEEVEDVEANKEILESKYDLTGTFSIPQDATGNWRKALVASTEYSMDNYKELCDLYYSTYAKSEKEILFVINFSTRTTISIKQPSTGIYEVTESEYIDKSEHSAKTINGGMTYAIYQVTEDGTTKLQ